MHAGPKWRNSLKSGESVGTHPSRRDRKVSRTKIIWRHRGSLEGDAINIILLEPRQSTVRPVWKRFGAMLDTGAEIRYNKGPRKRMSRFQEVESQGSAKSGGESSSAEPCCTDVAVVPCFLAPHTQDRDAL